jgi:hypothetical protein
MNDNQPFDRQSAADARLQLLVDGELSPAEYRTLVASLDEEPNGWRRCALAFLEEQALSRELGGDLHGITAGRQGVPVALPAIQRSPRGIPRGLEALLAIVASAAAAFILGVAAPSFFRARPQDSNLAGNFPTQASWSTDAGSPPAAGLRYPAPRSIGSLRLVMDGGDEESSQIGQLPIYEVEPGLDQFLHDDRPALAPELVRLLEQRGHTVQREQQYIPVALDDGRQVIVPVESYQITPVGRRVY